MHLDMGMLQLVLTAILGLATGAGAQWVRDNR